MEHLFHFFGLIFEVEDVDISPMCISLLPGVLHLIHARKFPHPTQPITNYYKTVSFLFLHNILECVVLNQHSCCTITCLTSTASGAATPKRLSNCGHSTIYKSFQKVFYKLNVSNTFVSVNHHIVLMSP